MQTNVYFGVYQFLFEFNLIWSYANLMCKMIKTEVEFLLWLYTDHFCNTENSIFHRSLQLMITLAWLVLISQWHFQVGLTKVFKFQIFTMLGFTKMFRNVVCTRKLLQVSLILTSNISKACTNVQWKWMYILYMYYM